MNETVKQGNDDPPPPSAKGDRFYREPATELVAIEEPNELPAELLRLAIKSGADPDRLERLLALQERWEATQARKAYDRAFTEFKAEAVRIIKNRYVADGPLKGKSYAELFTVVNAITPALSRQGLSASWKITRDEKDWIEVTCTLRHVDGHFESVAMGGPPDAGGAKNPIQARASTVSYLERYTLKAITGLSEQDDDNDGRGDNTEDAALLDTWRAVSLQGERALRAYYKSNPPEAEFWTRHAASLKDAAKKADADEALRSVDGEAP